MATPRFIENGPPFTRSKAEAAVWRVYKSYTVKLPAEKRAEIRRIDITVWSPWGAPTFQMVTAKYETRFYGDSCLEWDVIQYDGDEALELGLMTLSSLAATKGWVLVETTPKPVRPYSAPDVVRGRGLGAVTVEYIDQPQLSGPPPDPPKPPPPPGIKLRRLILED